MEFIDLKANKRDKTGKCPARVLRRDGMIPAVLYGLKAEPVKLSITVSDLTKAHKDSKTAQLFVSLDVEGGKRSAMLKELQIDPLTNDLIHADFLEVAMDDKIRVKTPVVVTGKSKGVEVGGILQIIRRELEVICKPMEVLEQITIDITELGMGDSVHVEDIVLEGDMEIPHEVNFTIVTCLAPKGAKDEDEEGEDEGAEEE